jgi:hypothetical protein
MGLSLTFAGPSTYRLVDDGVDVGRLAGNLLVFSGFATQHEAEHAGDAGYVALLQWMAYRKGGVREDFPAVHVALSENGTSEWLGPDGESLARAIPSSDPQGFVLEFTLPEDLYTAVAARAAIHVYESIAEARRELTRAHPEFAADAGRQPRL